MENKIFTTIQVEKITREKLAVIKAVNKYQNYNELILELIKHHKGKKNGSR